MNTFSIGEVAIFWCPTEESHGAEVTVTSAPMHACIKHLRTGESRICWVYCVIFPGEDHVGPVPADELRKKRPPQDWTTLCGLDSVPNGEPIEVA